MEKEKKSSFSLAIIAVVVIVLVVGAFYFGRGSNNQTPTTQSATELSNQAPTAQSSIQNNQTALSKIPIPYSQSQCDEYAKTYLSTWKPVESEYFKTVNLSQQNYYNQATGSCYVLVNFNDNMKDNIDGSYSLKITYTLVDLSKKDTTSGYGYPILGEYRQSVSSQKINNSLDACSVSGTTCYSLDGFFSLVNPYLGK